MAKDALVAQRDRELGTLVQRAPQGARVLPLLPKPSQLVAKPYKLFTS